MVRYLEKKRTDLFFLTTIYISREIIQERKILLQEFAEIEKETNDKKAAQIQKEIEYQENLTELMEADIEASIEADNDEVDRNAEKNQKLNQLEWYLIESKKINNHFNLAH